MIQVESLQTDEQILEFGPYDIAGFHGASIRLRHDGEIMQSCEIDLESACRGVADRIYQLAWTASLSVAGKMDPVSGYFWEWLLAESIEKTFRLEPSKRGATIRALVGELSRLRHHLYYLYCLTSQIEARAARHFLLRDIEKLLDLLEMITGSRYGLGFVRVGGVKDDLSEGFLDRILEQLKALEARLVEHHRIWVDLSTVLHRTQRVGVITHARAVELHWTGPNAQASGITECELRQFFKDRFQIESPQPLFVGAGDVDSRIRARYSEMSDSIFRVRELVKLLPKGHFRNSDAAVLRNNEKVSESTTTLPGARGQIATHINLSDRAHPVLLSSSAQPLVDGVSDAIQGEMIEDFQLILTSLDLSIPEAAG